MPLLPLFFLLIATSCGHLFYHPHDKIYLTPQKIKKSFQEITLEHSPVHHLKGWFVPAENEKARILFLHGNAENRSTHFFQMLPLIEYGFSFYIFDYSGYGDSQGTPSQRQLHADALLMMDHVLEQGVTPIIVWGQSLGGTVALSIAHEYQEKIDLLVLDSTFLSYREIARDVLTRSWFSGWLWPLVPALVSEEFELEKLAQSFKGKSLVIHSQKDQVVPFEMGVDVYLALGGRKRKLWIEDQLHIRALGSKRYQELIAKTVTDLIE